MSELEGESNPDGASPSSSKARKPKCDPCDVGAPLYMATFSDMAILLMAFFVLLLSMTEIDLRTWQKITGQIRLAFGTQSINLDFPIPKAQSMMIDNFSPNEAARNISSDVRQRVETEGKLRVRNTETYENQFDIEREFLILEAALESEISKGEVNIKIVDEQLVVEVPTPPASLGDGPSHSSERIGVVSQQLINASAKVTQIQSEITRDINVVATKNSFVESNSVSTGELLNKLQILREDLKTQIEEEILEVEMRNESIYIRVDSEDSFASGSADLQPNFELMLADLARSIAGLTQSISIEGHTDNMPISFQERFQSNWDLSAARASSVASVLMAQQGLSDVAYEVLGFADTVPIATNETSEGRSKNRRIEIRMADFK